MRYCENCGEPLSDEDLFCTECGYPVEEYDETGDVLVFEEENKEKAPKPPQKQSLEPIGQEYRFDGRQQTTEDNCESSLVAEDLLSSESLTSNHKKRWILCFAALIVLASL